MTKLSVGIARCPAIGSDEDGEWHWREGCDDCQRRVAWTRDDWIDPPPIIAFECEYRIGPEPLSPGARGVLRAAGDSEPGIHATIAAALRALADQVTPSDAVEPRNYLPIAIECQRIRSEILAIATELEGTNDPA